MESEWKSAKKRRQDNESKLRRWLREGIQRNPETLKKNIATARAEEDRLAEEIEDIDAEIETLDENYLSYQEV